MIDFSKNDIYKLKPTDRQGATELVEPILIQGETVQMAFQAVRDVVLFTDKRIIVVNLQGFTGKKRDFTSLPYARVQTFSVETAGIFNLDSQLTLLFQGFGKVEFEFAGKVDIREICRSIGECVLK